MGLISSCKVYAPVYKRVENFRLQRLDRDGFKVDGQIVLYNPNKMRAKLHDVLMNVEINGKHVATAGQKVEVPILAKSDFAVPLNLVIKPDMSLQEGITNLLGILTKKEMNVTVKGVIVIKIFGAKLSIPVDETEKVDITRLKW
jgi:LEA14-like dessication related protein